MRGLLTKDLKLMKNQRSFAVIFAAVILFYLFTETTAAIIIGYACIVSVIFIMGTISYDEVDNGNAYLFTLPFERKTYVQEKYILTVLTNIIVWFVSTALSAVFEIFRNPDLILSDYIAAAVTIGMIMLLFSAVIIPTQLKFGGNRGAIAIMLVFFVGSIIVYILIKLFHKFHIDLTAVINVLQSASPVVLFGICAFFLLVCLWISYFISLKVIKSKEF